MTTTSAVDILVDCPSKQDERTVTRGYGDGVWISSHLRQRCEWMKVDDTRCTLASLPRGRWCWLHADLAEADMYADLIHIDDPNNKVLTLAMLGEKIANRGDDDVLTWVAKFEQSLRYSSVDSRKLLMKDPPLPTGNQLHDALIAGLAEYLSWHDGISPPSWVYEDWRYCTPGLQTLCRPKKDASWSRARHVPGAFRMRGVYMSDQALEKV